MSSLETENAFFIFMIAFGLIGIIGSVIYYFARFSLKTDFDRDQERIQKEIDAQTAVAPVLLETTEQSYRRALSATRQNLFGRIWDKLVSSNASDALWEDLEEVLYTSDLGPSTVERLMHEVRSKTNSKAFNPEEIKKEFKSEILKVFADLPTPALPVVAKPKIILVVGVNGAGKTTTIGKLANQFALGGQKVMVAAGDTFRAAAASQLKIWSERAQVEIFDPPGAADPSGVAFDACAKAKAQGYDVVLVDTAGRLNTQKNLMEELKKIKRVIQKVDPSAPHEVLLVLDANSGQNALFQARDFHQAVAVTGVVLTKLDGSAKGGVAIGVANELKIPIVWVGLGEGLADLKPFSKTDFVESLF